MKLNEFCLMSGSTLCADKDTCQVTKPCVIQAPSTSAHCEDTPNTNAALLQGQVERLEKAIADRDLPRVSDILDKWPEIVSGIM